MPYPKSTNRRLAHPEESETPMFLPTNSAEEPFFKGSAEPPEYFDGDLDEIDLEEWYDLNIKPIEAPEDWTY
jgi:hypothetical protein